MEASRGHIISTAIFNTKHTEGSYLDVFKRKKYYYKLYDDRLEIFNSDKSSIKDPKFIISPDEETFVESLKSPPHSIKLHSTDVKIIIETKSVEMQSEWFQFLKKIFNEKAACTHCTPPEVRTKVNLSNELAVRMQKNNENSCEPKIVLPANLVQSKFVPIKNHLNISTSKTASCEETTTKNAGQQSNCSATSSKGITNPGANAKINPVTSLFPQRNRLILNSNEKGPSRETFHSNSPPMTSLPPIKPRGPVPTIIPSDDQYDEPEDYDSLEEQQAVQTIPPAPKGKERNCLEIIPIKLSRVLYSKHGWPLLLKFKDGKISLIKEESGLVIVNWEFRHIRKFHCKDDLFFFETGHKYPGGSKLFEFQLVEKVSPKSISEISEMIHQEMKSAAADSSKKIQSQKSDENLRTKISECVSSTSPKNFRSSSLFQSDVIQTPAVPPPFTSKPKAEFKRADVIIIPSDDLYDELVDYDGLEEDPTEQLTTPLLPVNQPHHDIKNQGTRQYGYLWEQTTSLSPQYTEVRTSISDLKDESKEGPSSSKIPFGPQRYKGPIDDSLYALPS